MAPMSVRRLAAADMWGTAGSPRRRRLIYAEFVVGAVGCTVLGLVVLTSAGGYLLLLGAWLVGAGVNYVPLALYARSLSRHGALAAELREVDLRSELRRAGVHQLWIAVPFAVAIAAVAQELGRVR